MKRPTERPGFELKMPKKQTWELFGFLAIILFLVGLILFSPYFQIRDIAISGLDAATSTRVRGALNTILQAKTLGVRHDGYFLVRSGKVEEVVRNTIAVDEISIKIVFPHSLEINVQEVPVRFRVLAANGIAYLDADGSVVRWYDSTSTAAIGQTTTEIQTTDPILNRQLHESVFEQLVMQAIAKISAKQFEIDSQGIERVTYSIQAPDRLDVQFKRGVVINFTVSEVMDAQIKKAQLAMRTYATAKKIDVRFGDKAFVQL